VYDWFNERTLEKWWKANQPDALSARIKSGAFFLGVKTATLTMPGGRTITGELNVLGNSEGYPWFRITDGNQSEFHSFSRASIENPLYPDTVTLPDGMTLHLHRDEVDQRKLQRIRQIIED